MKITMNYISSLIALQLKLIFLIHLKKKINIVFLIKNILLILSILIHFKFLKIIFIMIFLIYHTYIIRLLYLKNRNTKLIAFLEKNRFIFNKNIFYIIYFLSLMCYFIIDTIIAVVLF